MPGITIWLPHKTVWKRQVRVYFGSGVSINLNLEQYKGVQLKDIPQVEDLFKVNINIHTLLDADTAISVYLSQCQYTATLYCHLWGHHLSYISDFNVFAKRFQCHLCDKLFKTVQEAKRHEKTCKEGTKFIYPGGYHRVPPTVFEDLDSYGINVPKQDRLYPFFCCFDWLRMNIKRARLQQCCRPINPFL